MSRVMTENKISIRYAYSRGHISQHWVKTGQFCGYGNDVMLDCDTEEKRALIVALDWHEERYYSSRPSPDVRVLGKYRQRLRSDMAYDYDELRDYFDHELSVDEIWLEIKRMAQEKMEQVTDDNRP